VIHEVNPPPTELVGYAADGHFVGRFDWSYRQGLWEGRLNGLLVCVPRREQAEACLRKLGAKEVRLGNGRKD